MARSSRCRRERGKTSGPLSLWERVRVRAARNSARFGQSRSPHPDPLPEGEGENVRVFPISDIIAPDTVATRPTEAKSALASIGREINLATARQPKLRTFHNR